MKLNVNEFIKYVIILFVVTYPIIVLFTAISEGVFIWNFFEWRMYRMDILYFNTVFFATIYYLIIEYFKSIRLGMKIKNYFINVAEVLKNFFH